MSKTVLSLALPVVTSLLIRETALRVEHPVAAETEATVVEVVEDYWTPYEPEVYVVVSYADGRKTRQAAISYADQLQGAPGPGGLSAAKASFPTGSSIRIKYAPGYPRFGLAPVEEIEG